jgi:hypothetical protein
MLGCGGGGGLLPVKFDKENIYPIFIKFLSILT